MQWQQYVTTDLLNGPEAPLKMQISEELDCYEMRDPYDGVHKLMQNPLLGRLYIVLLLRNYDVPLESRFGAWTEIGSYRIWKYWFDVDQDDNVTSLKVFTGESLPGLWVKAENPFSEEQEEDQIFGMVTRKGKS